MELRAYKKIIFLLLILMSPSSYAYVACTVAVDSVQSASSSGFHNFNEMGFTGGTVFVAINPVNCSFKNGDTSTGTSTFLILDQMDAADSLKKSWVSILIAAQTTSKRISFHATNKGNNARGFQGLQPYFISLID